MTERSDQNDACVAATFAATQASRALHPVIEIVGERRRAYDDAFRRRVVLASYETGQSVRAVARQFGVHVSVVYRWRQRLDFVNPSAKEQLSFVPVHMTSPVEGLGGDQSCGSGHEASILFPGGEKLMVDSRIAIEDLRKLLQVFTLMIPLPSGLKIWLAAGATDMRLGMPGLALRVQQFLGRDPYAGDVFVFRGRRGDLVKLIWHDGIGVSLYAKRIERGYFIWPSAKDGAIHLSASQLSCLLEGIDWRNPQKTWRPELAG